VWTSGFFGGDKQTAQIPGATGDVLEIGAGTGANREARRPAERGPSVPVSMRSDQPNEMSWFAAATPVTGAKTWMWQSFATEQS
jgi:hypothetical protein